MKSLKKFKHYFPSGSSQCFLGECDDNIRWVIRLKIEGKDSRRLFSQFVVCNLAKLIGIACPDVRLVKINFDSESAYIKNLSQFDKNSNIGVGNIYLDNLNPFPLPPKYKEIRDKTSFGTYNYKHVSQIITDREQLSQLYGLHLFSSWVFLEDFRTYEDLHIVNNKLYFVDFDVALSEGNSSFSKPQSYNSANMGRLKFEFLKGLNETKSDYKFWIQKILSIPKSDIENIFELIPDCWEIPIDYFNSIQKMLIEDRKFFIEQFNQGLNIRIR